MESIKALATMAPFREVMADPSRVALAWKARGKKVAGYRCLYVPEEIIWAAGMLPYPLYGTSEPIGLADSYFQSCTCEFVRNIFDRALEGRYAFLDGLVLSNTCDVVRRLYDMWSTYIKPMPIYMINNPQQLMTEGNREYYLTELRAFIDSIEALSGVAVTEPALRAAIALYNETRDLLKAVYALREQDPPPLTAEEALELCTAVSIMPKDEANPLLRALLDELKTREMPERFGPRIMVMGSVMDNPALVRMVEEEGGVVVADDLCNTTRYFWQNVDEAGDPLEAIYRFLNTRPMCACMHPTEARQEYLMGLVDRFQVEAVINFNVKYCHPFMHEAPLFKKALEARNIPTNVLEVGHDLSGHGQLRTRIQAFVEMVSF